jgi:hypothetical protein
MDQQRRYDWACRLRSREEVAVRRWQAVLLALVVGGVVAIGMVGLAQDAKEIQIEPGLTPTRCWMECPTTSHPCSIYQYSVKVVEGLTSDTVILGPGQYTTSVNIHNPWCHAVKYEVKLALADRNGVQGVITLYSSFTLGPDGVTEFDSVGFATLLNAVLPTFFEGYFVIQCEEELDVVAVYAATVDECASHGLSTIETERVPARVVPRGRDLSTNISTGVAAWMITSVPNGSHLSVGPAPISNAPCGDWVMPWVAGVQWGAQWVGMSNCVASEDGGYDYDYTFNLCCDFYDARICLRLWVDDDAKVYLNDMSQAVATVSSNYWLSNITPTWITHGFRVGQNTLRIHVTNVDHEGDNTTTGIMVDGWLCVEAGNCP